MLGQRPSRQEVDERLVGVGALPGGAHGIRGGARGHPGGAGGEDAARHRGERGGERDGDRAGAGRGEVLLDLGRVPVHAADAVGRHRAHHLGAEQVRLERLAGARGAGGRDDGDVVGLEHAGDEPGGQGQRDGGRVAARHGDAAWRRRGQRAGPGGGGQLGHAVGPRPGVRGVVEGGPGALVGEPEVGAAVDDDHVVAQLGRQGRRVAVRQGEHDGVVAGEHLGGGVLEQPVGQRGQVRVDAAQRLAGVRRGGEGTDLEVGVLQQQAHDLTAGVPARPGDCDTSHVHDYTESLDSMHTAPARSAATSRPVRQPSASQQH